MRITITRSSALGEHSASETVVIDLDDTGSDVAEDDTRDCDASTALGPDEDGFYTLGEKEAR